MRVGCDPREHEPQRIFVNVTIEGNYAAKPKHLSECINYDLVYHKIMKEWPSRPHTQLLETRIAELLEYIFRSDERVTRAKVSLSKPDVFPEVESIGLEAEWTREEFEQLKNS